ncbi:3-ketoacyl-ACP reductase [Siccirubricoccus deserti]|uniref:SDR family oxidoreductase n=1 Tax=Siccirubricoccus deserti TaxID=2013562 RepID=A0A9X0R0E3_9PROT|nr:SDR family oxidoreductase [Siccirubricoccus deserti]MBC4016523.1 SDR family oxidoreductase [Siccirubricoccus deserti]GGC49762.1 3-ketoacyl-ACP reductase [Siccirubricoccus deserti]
MSEARAGNLGEYQLAGKVAVITGGSNGIGAATARRLAAAGATVVVGYNEGVERATALAASLPGSGHLALRTPMEDSAALRAAAAEVQAKLGRCDILVNSAATTRAVPHSDLEALDDALIDRVLVTNVRGPFATIRAFAPMLKASGDAVIINISSLAAITGTGSSIIYGASKAALDTIGTSLARVLGPEIRVVSISPSAVATDFVPGRSRTAVEKQAASSPLQRVTEADDVALAIMATVTHLRLTTGSVILVDGGKHL